MPGASNLYHHIPHTTYILAGIQPIMRVMLFTDTYPPQVNGVATCVKTLARSLSEQGHSVMVCTVLARHTRHTRQRTRLSAEEPFPVVRTRAVTVPLYAD